MPVLFSSLADDGGRQLLVVPNHHKLVKVVLQRKTLVYFDIIFKPRNKAQRKVDYKNYDAITMRRNFQEKLSADIIKRNYQEKL